MTLSRRTCPCLDCKTVRSLGKLGSLRREHGYCTTLQLIYALSGDTVPSLYTLSRKTCPCLDCKTVRSLRKLGSLRREHGYCTALQLIYALSRNSCSVCMSDSRGSAIISLTCVQSGAIVGLVRPVRHLPRLHSAARLTAVPCHSIKNFSAF